MVISLSDPNISYLLLSRAFARLGYATSLFTVDGKERAEYRHPNGKFWTTSTALVSYPFNSPNLKEVSDNKSKGYEVARSSGVSIPEFIVAGPTIHVDDQTIEELLSRHGRLIVKPDASFGSRGVSTNLTDVGQVRDAIVAARGIKQQHSNVLIQQYVTGNEYRFTVLQGNVVSVMLREKARIVGDGKSTIRQLIEREDAERERINQTSMVRYPSVAEIVHDKDLLSSSDVLADGEVKILSHSAMVSGGTSVYEVVDQIHDSYKDIAVFLANELQAGFIVVDMFIQDPSSPATLINMFFNEFNRSPALKMLYASRNGSHVDIAELLAKAIDDYL